MPFASPRLDSIDALRAIALAGILIVNAMTFAAGFGGDSLGGLDARSSTADIAAYALTAFFFEYKFYPIFATLMGFGACELWQRWRWQGRRSRIAAPWLRRMVALAALGLLNGIFIYAGDVLIRYAMAGSLFWLLSPARMSAKRAFRRAAMWALIALGLGFVFGLIIAGARAWGEGFSDFVGRDNASFTIYAWGSFGQVTEQRLADFAAIVSSAPFYSIPCFVACLYFGYGIARSRLWTRALARRSGVARRWVKFGLLFGIPLNVAYAGLKVLGQVQATTAYLSVESMLALPVSILSFAYVGAWLLVWPHLAHGWQKVLAAAGRIALTNYLFSALIFSALLYGYGFGYGDDWGQAQLFIVSLCVWIAVVLLSVGWQIGLGAGPFERLYRSLGGR
jgi:uncharacterized protein